MALSNAQFLEQIGAAAQEDMSSSGILASITTAQAILESNWGKSAPGNNLFGIKGEGMLLDTKEYINGQWVTVKESFRTYPDWAGSIRDHAKFLLENSRYAKAGFFVCCAAYDYKCAARALQTAQYATDPQYADSLIKLIETYSLYKLDQEVKTLMQVIDDLKAEVAALQARLTAVESTMQLPSVPDWAKASVQAAVEKGLVDTPNGGSYDFYRILTVLHRKGLF